MRKLAVVILAGVLCAGCGMGALGAAASVMQGIGDASNQSIAQNNVQNAYTSCQQGDPAACTTLQYYQQQYLLRQQEQYQQQLQRQQQLEQNLSQPTQTLCHPMGGGAVSCSQW